MFPASTRLQIILPKPIFEEPRLNPVAPSFVTPQCLSHCLHNYGLICRGFKTSHDLPSTFNYNLISLSLSFFFFFFFFFLGFSHCLWDFSGLGVDFDLPTHHPATARWDSSYFCSLYYSSRQCCVLNPLSGEARDQTHILMDAPWARYH